MNKGLPVLFLFFLTLSNMLGTGFFMLPVLINMRGYWLLLAVLVGGLIVYTWGRSLWLVYAQKRNIPQGSLPKGLYSIFSQKLGTIVALQGTFLYTLSVMVAVLVLTTYTVNNLIPLFPILISVYGQVIASIVLLIVLSALLWIPFSALMILTIGVGLIKLLWIVLFLLGVFFWGDVLHHSFVSIPRYALPLNNFFKLIIWILWTFMGIESFVWFVHLFPPQPYIKRMILTIFGVMTFIVLVGTLVLAYTMSVNFYQYGLQSYSDITHYLFGHQAYDIISACVAFTTGGAVFTWLLTLRQMFLSFFPTLNRYLLWSSVVGFLSILMVVYTYFPVMRDNWFIFDAVIDVWPYALLILVGYMAVVGLQRFLFFIAFLCMLGVAFFIEMTPATIGFVILLLSPAIYLVFQAVKQKEKT